MAQQRQQLGQTTAPQLWAVLSPTCNCPDTCINKTATNAGRCSPDCAACDCYGQVLRLNLEEVSVSVATNKNSRLSLLLSLSPLVCRLYQVAMEGQRDLALRRSIASRLQQALGTLLACGDDKVNLLRSLGRLSIIVPNILQLRLASGWSRALDALRKVSTAVCGQTTRTCQLLALMSIRKTLEKAAEALEAETPSRQSLLQWAQALCAGRQERSLEEKHFPQVSH